MLEVVVVVVVLLVVVVVGVVVLVEVLVGVEVDVVLVLDDVVGIDGVDAVCWWQSLWASCAIVPAAWVRLLRSVELIVTGSVSTSLLKTELALTAAPQLPCWTAEATASAWLLSAAD